MGIPPNEEEYEEPVVHELAENEYVVELTERPFGIAFGKNPSDKRNLFVTGLDEGGPGEAAQVMVGSKIVRLQNESVEDLGAKNIFKLFKDTYGEVLPLSITFKRPSVEQQQNEYQYQQEVGEAEDAQQCEQQQYEEQPPKQQQQE